VNIVAFATADHKQNVVAPITVSGFAGNLNGRYVFQATGTRPDAAQNVDVPYQITGVVNLDGNGGVRLTNVNGLLIGGEQTYSGKTGFAVAHITGGTYSLGPDGRGILTIATDDSTLGAKGTETFSLSFLSNSTVLIAQVDGTASVSGSMELQSSSPSPIAGFAFVLSGTDGAGSPTALGGILNIDQPNGGISGNGTVADQSYLGLLRNCQGLSVGGGTGGISGSVSAPDIFGGIQFQLATCFSQTPLQFKGYIVDNRRIKLIETDLDPKSGKGFATAGIAIGQGSATGTFTGAQSFTGNYVFGISGFDSGIKLPSSLTLAGSFAASGTGTLTGSNDEVIITKSTLIGDGFSGNYIVDPSGVGRVDVPVAFNQSTNVTLSTPELIFYLSGNGGPALVLDSDVTAGAVGVGTAFPQASSPIAFGGNYGFYWSNLTQANFGQAQGAWTTSDTTGTMTVDGASKTVDGLVDGPGFFGQNAIQLTGDLQSPSHAPPGVFGGSLTALNSGLGATPVQVDYYLADSNHGFVLETDLASSTLLGYFAARTPVCPGCP